MVIVGLLGGCRLGELLALDWSDIREDEGIILVRRSQHCGVETETKKSRWRSVWLHPMVREALEAHRRASLGEKVERLARGLVFPSKKTGGYHTASFLAKPFARMRKRAGITIRFTPQGMRRTANNLRRQLGIDRTVIRDEIGHASDRMTDHYSTVTVHEKRDAVERLVRAIDGASDAAEVAPVVAPGVAPEVAPRASVDGKAAPSGSKSATKSA